STDQLASLALCPNIQELEHSLGHYARDLGPEDWAAITGLAHLRRVGLQSIYYHAGDEETRHLATMRQLEALDLTFAHVSDAGVANLAALDRLEVLRLASGSSGEGLSDAGAEAISSLRRLRVLDLSWHERVTDVGLGHLLALKRLTY